MNTKRLKGIFAIALYGMVIGALVISVAHATPVSAARDKTTGERISLYYTEWMNFPIDTPFHIQHGWIQPSDDDAIGVFDFKLEVDGSYQKEDFKNFWAESGDPDLLHRLWIFNFPAGMTGTHTFTGHWFAPCQYAVDWLGYPGTCTRPNKKVETHTATLTVEFVLPTFVAYKPSSIEGYDWPMGDTVSINVNDGEYTDEAISEQRPNFPYGTTRVLFETWQDDFSFETGDHIVMTNGVFTKEVEVTNLEVTGFDVGARTVFGVYDPRFTLWAWLYDIEGLVPDSDPVAGTWMATFSVLPSGAWGGATQWDEDGDGTSLDFQVP